MLYTGEQLRVQIENLTSAASIDDVQILINCHDCRITSFSARGVTCQPPRQLACPTGNSSTGTIRFRLGYREHFIGYLSYEKPSVSIERFVMLISCLLTIVVLLCSIGFYVKMRSFRQQTSSISEERSRECWSTKTSSDVNAYYQVYEQIPSLCSTLFPKNFQVLSMENQQLRKLFFSSNFEFEVNPTDQSMEIFFDLLNLKSFSDSFALELNHLHLIECYIYVFRWNVLQLKSLPTIRQTSYLKFISTILIDSKENFVELFEIFDYLLSNLIEFLDRSPTDQLLNRSLNSFSPSSLLIHPNLSFQLINLSINYENLFHFNVQVFDCDTIDQVKQKLVKFLNFYEKKMSIEQIDLLIPLKSDRCLIENQIPMMKNYSINSTIFCRKRLTRPNIRSNYSFHLLKTNQFNDNRQILNEKLKQNFQNFEKIFENFLGKLLQTRQCFSIWQTEIFAEHSTDLFESYIQLVTDLIRHLNSINFLRPNCPIIQSALNSIADGIEFIFQTKDQVTEKIKFNNFIFLFNSFRRKFKFCSKIKRKSSVHSIELDSKYLRTQQRNHSIIDRKFFKIR